MTRFILSGLFVLSAFALGSPSANAQCLNCPFPQIGGNAFCMVFGARMHQHGPLYNYTPGYGGGAYGYGSGYTSPWGNHGDRMSCGRIGGGFGGFGLMNHGGFGLFNHGGCSSCGGGWGHYAVSTFQNVFHRVHPFASRCGHTCSVGCSSCGGAAAPAPTPAK